MITARPTIQLIYFVVLLFLFFFDKQDQFENLAAHTHKGIEFLDKYGGFVRDRCAIEVEYAAKLRYSTQINFFRHFQCTR